MNNNIVGTYTATDVHSNTYTRSGVAWSNNLFFGGDAAAISGTDAATGAVFDDALLSKVDGWTLRRTLSPLLGGRTGQIRRLLTAAWISGRRSPPTSTG